MRIQERRMIKFVGRVNECLDKLRSYQQHDAFRRKYESRIGTNPIRSSDIPLDQLIRMREQGQLDERFLKQKNKKNATRF